MNWISPPNQTSPIFNVRSKIVLQPFGNNSLNYIRGMLESQVSSCAYEGSFPFLVKAYKEDQPALSQLVNPKICLLRIPKRKRRKLNIWDGAKGWVHPTHLNGTGNVLGNKYADGVQSSGIGLAMNPIVTEWPLIQGVENIASTCSISPLDWYRRDGQTFGSSTLPMSQSDWDNGSIQLRGLGSKSPGFTGITKQFRFKVRIEAQDPNDSRKRVVSTPSQETLILYPKKGSFSISGSFDINDPSTFNFWYYAFDLKLANF